MAAATARRARDPAAYRAALDLYAGDVLPEDRYEEWAEPRREELRSLHLVLRLELAGLYEEHEEYKPAVEALRRVVAEEPTNEEAHAGLMRLHALSGRPGQAFSQYERLREILSKQLGTEPGTATRSLHKDIVSGRFPTPRAQPADPSREAVPDPTKHNLPAQRTSFVGREREMTEVKRELAMTRLLTLTGVGGSGKTRLALEVARDLVVIYPDGVWLAELAGLSEGDLVPQAVAGALGVKEQPGQALAKTLAEALRYKEMLLVLDNCEHLIEAAAQLVDALLSSCPRLRVLATSREALDVAGEIRWTVPSLSLRTCLAAFIDGGGTGRLRLRTSVLRTCLRQAARVYVHCGEREDCGEDMSTLGRRTASYRAGGSEGWDTPSCPVEQISEKLEDALTLLTGGGRMAVPRQRTLKGTLDWSHDLLGEPEQVMFRRLAVFASGWTLEASRAVASGEGIEEGDALELFCVVSPRVLCRPPSHYPTRCQRRTPLWRGKEEA